MPAVPSTSLVETGVVVAREIMGTFNAANSLEISSGAPVAVRAAADEPDNILGYVEELIEREPAPQYSSSSFGGSSSSSPSSSSSFSSDDSSSSGSDENSSSSYPSSTSVSDSCEGWVVCRPDGYYIGGSSGGGSSISSSGSNSGSIGSGSSSSSGSSGSGSGGQRTGQKADDGLGSAGVRSGVSIVGLFVAVLAATAVLV